MVVVEDDPMVAALLRDTLATDSFDIQIGHSAAEAVRVARRLDPDIAIVDINLGRGASGVDLAFILSKQHPGIAILLLTQHPDLRTAGFEAADLPPNTGFLRKSAVMSKNDILSAIDALVVSDDNAKRHAAHQDHPLGALTDTQIEVLRLVAKGYTNQEIARRRNTSKRAVEQVLNAIYLGLGIDPDEGIHPRVEAARRFIQAAGTPDRI